MPLIQGAIDLLANCAIDILRAREIYATTMAAARRRGVCYSTCSYHAERALRRITTPTPKGPRRIASIADLAELVDLLYAACFVVIAYLVGPRVSELLELRSGCLLARSVHGPSGETELTLIVGSIFRGEPGYHGRVHEWVAPQATVHAISVLEALSAPHRQNTGRNNLWLRALGRGRAFGAKEWHVEFKGPWHIPTSPASLPMRTASPPGSLCRTRVASAGIFRHIKDARASSALPPFAIAPRCSPWLNISATAIVR